MYSGTLTKLTIIWNYTHCSFHCFYEQLIMTTLYIYIILYIYTPYWGKIVWKNFGRNNFVNYQTFVIFPNEKIQDFPFSIQISVNLLSQNKQTNG